MCIGLNQALNSEQTKNQWEEIRFASRKEFHYRVQNTEDLCFETIPIHKMIIMSIITFGFYNLVVHAKYWEVFTKKTKIKVSPGLRAFLNSWTFFSLMPILKTYFNKHNVKTFPACQFILPLLHFLFLSTLNVLTSIGGGVFLIFLPLSTLFLIYVQCKINAINKKQFKEAKVNGWNLSNKIYIGVLLSIPIILNICLGNTDEKIGAIVVGGGIVVLVKFYKRILCFIKDLAKNKDKMKKPLMIFGAALLILLVLRLVIYEYKTVKCGSHSCVIKINKITGTAEKKQIQYIK